MDRESLENLDEESLFQIQNTISEIIKERNFKKGDIEAIVDDSFNICLLYTSPSPRDRTRSRMPSSA